MKNLSILIILAMFGTSFGCSQDKGSSESDSPVNFNKLVCADLIKEVTKLNGKSPMVMASKIVEMNAQDPASADKTTSCLDANLKIVCNETKCSVAKRDI